MNILCVLSWNICDIITVYQILNFFSSTSNLGAGCGQHAMTSFTCLWVMVGYTLLNHLSLIWKSCDVLFKSGELSCVILSYTPHPPHDTVCVHQIASQVSENASRNLPRIQTKKKNRTKVGHSSDFWSSVVECHVEDVQRLDCFVRQHSVPQERPLPERGSESVLRVCGGSAFRDWALITGLSLCFHTDISHQTPRHSCDSSLFLTLKLLPKN